MKLFVFSKWSYGGLSTFFQQLNKIKNKKLNIKFFLFHPTKDEYKFKGLNYKIIYPHLSLKSDSILLFPIKFFFFFKDLLKTFFIIRKKEKIITLAADLYSLVILSFIKNISKINIIFIVNINYEKILEKRKFFIKKIIFFLTKLALKKVNYIIFTSKELKKNFFCLFKTNINKKNSVIYHGIKVYERYKKIRYYIKKNPIILYVGRLDEQKDVETIIKAFYKISKKIKKAKLWIVGDGENSEKLKKLVLSLDLKSKVSFFGWQKNVDKFYQKADLFVFSSNYEGFSYVIIEAMSHGLPIITTNSPYGPKEIIKKNKYGILVPVKDIEKMRKAIEKILTNKKIYIHYSKMALKRVEFFSEKKMLNKFKKIFQRFNLIYK
jgi:glycosyltransferase involved in cell wall biosynthesis